jgi:hypothetical protein
MTLRTTARPQTPRAHTPRTSTSRTPTTRSRRRARPDLERQSISFTVGLYLFICVAVLLAHVTAGGA